MGHLKECSIIWYLFFFIKKTSLLPFFIFFSFITSAQVVNINVISNTPSCFGICCGSAEIVASGDDPPFFYQWSNGSSGTGIFNLVPGTYSVTVTDSNGITEKEEIVIGDLGVDYEISEWNPQTCFGDEDVILKDSVTEGLSPFNFSIYDSNDNLISFFGSLPDSTHFYQNLAGGETYRIMISDDRVCFSEKFFTTNEKPEFLASLGDDINLPPGEAYPLQALFNQNYTSINWTPATGLSCTDCSDPIVTANENICYIVQATNSDGCIATDTLCIFTESTSNKNLTDGDFSIDIFTNPVKNELNIQTDFSEKWNLNILDIHGNVLLWKIHFKGFSNKINVRNFPKGLYFLEIKNEKNTIQRELKFIKT